MILLSSINWGKFGIVLGLLAVLSIVFTVLILLVSKICAIKEDPKISQIHEKLCGANCGGCGFAGCADFAKALVEGKATVDKCAATSNENKKEIAKILGVEVADSQPLIAVVKCSGNYDTTSNKCEYVGNQSCESKNMFFAGDKTCNFACLGGGSCSLNCVNKCIEMENGLAKNNHIENCIGCGICVRNCPKHIIELIPANAKVFIACSNKCKGKEVMEGCKVGCIGCGLCAKNCPQGAITMIDNLPVIDYTKCNGCQTCQQKCPRKIIKEVK